MRWIVLFDLQQRQRFTFDCCSGCIFHSQIPTSSVPIVCALCCAIPSSRDCPLHVSLVLTLFYFTLLVLLICKIICQGLFCALLLRLEPPPELPRVAELETLHCRLHQLHSSFLSARLFCTSSLFHFIYYRRLIISLNHFIIFSLVATVAVLLSTYSTLFLFAVFFPSRF